MWKSILKAATWILLKIQWYRRWSNTYRWLFEKKYKDVKIPIYQYVHEITEFISQRTWKKDGWRTLGDAVSYPGKLQWIANNKMDDKVGDVDCDENALYCVAALNIMKENNLIKFQQGPHLCSVVWQVEGKVFPKGHNICVWQTIDGTWRWMSNWKRGRVLTGESLQAILDQCVSYRRGKLLFHMRCGEDLVILDWGFHD